MTNFEIIGVDRQNNSVNTYQAKKNLERSCEICAAHGIRIPGGCDRCAINAAHQDKVLSLKLAQEGWRERLDREFRRAVLEGRFQIGVIV